MSVFVSEDQWLSQMRAMRQAIADLNLPPLKPESEMYGADLDLNEDSSDSLEEDIWDVESEVDDSPPSDVDLGMNGYHTPEAGTGNAFGRHWLQQKCQTLAVSKSGMNAEDLEQQIVALLATDSNDEELQMSLAEIVGFGDLDFVIELISHRKEVLAQPKPSANQTDSLFGNLQTRQEREGSIETAGL